MLTIGKSTMLFAAFLAVDAIAASQQPPSPQIAALPPQWAAGQCAASANAATKPVVASYTAAAVDRPRRVLCRFDDRGGIGARRPHHYCLPIPQPGQHEDRAGQRHDFVSRL